MSSGPYVLNNNGVMTDKGIWASEMTTDSRAEYTKLMKIKYSEMIATEILEDRKQTAEIKALTDLAN
jgi:hypothetical protein